MLFIIKDSNEADPLYIKGRQDEIGISLLHDGLLAVYVLKF